MKNECKLVQRSAMFVGHNEKSLLPITSDLYQALKSINIELENVLVYVNGVYISPMELTGLIPKTGDVIEVDIIPAAGPDAKVALRTVALIAVTIAAVYVAGPAGAAFLGSKLAAIAAGVTISVVGSLAINALIPPPQADLVSGLGSNLSRDYAITGSQNNYTPYAPIPKIFGKHRIYPPKASLEYTELVGQEQFLNSLFCIGYGPLDITEIKIGETNIADFGDAEYEIGTVDAPPILFPSLVDEQQLNILIDRDAGAWQTLTTEPNTRRVSIDIFFPILTGHSGKSERLYMYIEFRKVGDSTWINPITTATYNFGNLGSTRHISTGNISVTSKTGGSRKVGVWFNTEASHTHSTNYGSYEVRISRDPYLNVNDADDAYISAFRSFINDNPIKTTDNSIVYVATRLRASDKLNGVIDNFNCIAQAHHPVYNGSTWNIEATRNPAWAYVDLLTGGATPTALAYSRLNVSDILEWATINDTEGFKFDFILTKQATISEIANQICPIGRAVPAIKDGLHTVVIDKTQTIPAQIFTARNSWGFQGSKIFTERIHGFKTTFVNEDNGYQVDEVIVYDDGYSVDNATKFNTLSLNGVTTSDHAWKLGRYHIAVNRLRPETYEIYTDVENIRCTRGDLVYLNYDVILIGLGAARIKSIQLGTPSGGNVDFTLTIDDAKTLENTKTYAINIRTNDSSVYNIVLDTPATTQIDTFELTGTTTETIANALAVGNLLQFGESGAVSEEMIVKYISPGRDLTAKLTLIHYDAAILNADQGTIPPFDSNITNPPDVTKFVPLLPNINKVTSDETVIIVQKDGTLVSVIVVNFNIPSSGKSIIPTTLQTQYKPSDENEGGWVDVPVVPANTGIVSIQNVEDGVQYSIRMRFVSIYNVPSDWVEITHTVVGKAGIPPAVDNFNAIFIDNQVELQWSKSTAPDIRNYKLSYGSFADEYDLGFSDTTTFRTPVKWAGTRTFWIIPYDTSGNAGDAVSTTLENILPTISSFTSEVIDNNVVLRWVNVKGSLPIVSNEIRRGAIYISPTKTIGTKKGTFTSFFESKKGVYTYWATAEDSAGNTSTPVSINVQVNEPPDFVLYTDIFEGFSNGTLYTNCFADEEEKLYIPVNIAETWTQHFTNNSNTSFQDFIDDGYNTYAEPSLSTGEYNEEFNLGAVVPSANISLVLDTTTIGSGTVTLETYIDYKKLVGDSWTLGANSDTVLALDFQYIRVRYKVIAVSDDKTYLILNKQTIDVSAKAKKDSGNGSYTKGYALKSDATNDYYALAPDSTSLDITGSVSVACWMKVPLSAVSTINVGFKEYYGIRYNGSAGTILGGGPQGLVNFDASDWKGHWLHVVSVLTATDNLLYINGVEVDDGSGYAPTSSSGGFYIAGGGAAGGLPGAVNNMRVYSGVLTAAEVLSLYKDNTYTPAATLEAKWDFTEGTGTTAADTSGNSNTATLSSANMWTDDQGAVVFFNKTFVDIQSVIPSLKYEEGNESRTIYYDFLDIPYPKYFHALPYDSGVRTSADFSWEVSGL